RHEEPGRRGRQRRAPRLLRPPRCRRLLRRAALVLGRLGRVAAPALFLHLGGVRAGQDEHRRENQPPHRCPLRACGFTLALFWPAGSPAKPDWMPATKALRSTAQTVGQSSALGPLTVPFIGISA